MHDYTRKILERKLEILEDEAAGVESDIARDEARIETLRKNLVEIRIAIKTIHADLANTEKGGSK